MNKVYTKLAVLILAGAMIMPIGVNAQDVSQLQAQINSLLQLITQLQAQIQNLSGSGVGQAVFTRNLTSGSTGSEVERLQRFLVARGHLNMPPGVAFGYFGPLTRDALAAFQSVQAISPAVGYFGPITRARVNTLISTTTPPTTGTTTPSGITTPGVEGTMSVTSSNAGINSTIYEGDDEVAVLGMEIAARMSDIAVQRVRINLGNSSAIYNRILSKLYVTDGTNVLASTDLNSSTVVRENSNYYITISGFNYIVPKDDERNLIIKADVRPSIDSDDLSVSRTISLSDNGVRGIDGAGIDHYSPSTGSSVSRTLNVNRDLAETATLRISLNSNTPRSQEVIASEGAQNNELDKLTLLSFDLKAERDDITVTDLEVDVSKAGSGSATASSTVYLYDGNTEIDNASVSNGTATFQDLDYRVPRDTTKTLSVRVDVRNANTSTSNFTASIPASGIIAENALGDTLGSSDVSGSATGYAISVRNVGPEVTLVSKSVTTNGVPQGSGSNANATSSLTATFNVRIRAIGSDLILGNTASATPAFDEDTTLALYRNGSVDSSIDPSVAISYSTPSGATTAGLTNSFRIPEGSEVTIPVTFQILGREGNGSALPAGLYSIGFEGFRWVSDTGSGTTTFMSGLQDWRTADVSFP